GGASPGDGVGWGRPAGRCAVEGDASPADRGLSALEAYLRGFVADGELQAPIRQPVPASHGSRRAGTSAFAPGLAEESAIAAAIQAASGTPAAGGRPRRETRSVE